MQVRKLNGKVINNLPELMCLVEGCKDPYLHFDLDHNSVSSLLARIRHTCARLSS